MELHEITNLWPQMSSDEWDEFCADVAENGLLSPIVTWRNSIVDGKHRFKACEAAGIEARYDALPDDWNEWRVVKHCSSLHRRRNLTPAQRAAVAAEAVTRFAPRAKERQKQSPGRPPKDSKKVPPAGGKFSDTGTAAKEAAEALNSTERSVERAKFVLDRAPEVHAKVKAGDVSLKVAERVAKAPEAKRAAMLNQLDTKARKQDASDSWGTPPEWLDLVRQAMGEIDLDPASNAEAQAVVRAKEYFTKEDDGLTKTWKGRVWMNPPYSQPLVGQFSQKLIASLEAGDVTEACVLVNNATDSKFCQLLLSKCAVVLFPKGRVKFLVPGSGEALQGTRQGQVLIYFGKNKESFIAVAKSKGWVGVNP